MGEFIPTYSTDNIWREENMDQCLSNDLNTIESNISTLQSGKANTVHTHSGYAATTHTHDGYAMSTHIHSNYALASDLSDLQAQVGDVSVSQQISTAIASKADANHTHTGYATESYVNTQVSGLVDSAPETLNTLNELAAALGDDPNFASTIATQIGGKADANHTHTGYANADHAHAGYAESGHTHSNYALTNHAHTGYASATDVSALQTLVGDTAVSTQIASAVAGKADTSHTHSTATTSAAGMMSAADKVKLNGIAAGANNVVIDSALSSSSTNPLQNKVIKSALDGKANANHVHNVFSSLTEIGITTFPTTMSAIVAAMPQNSMIIMDTRRINGEPNDYATEIISDWGNSANGMAVIFKGHTAARVTMMIMYGTNGADHGDLTMGNYAAGDNRVNWTTLADRIDPKVDKVRSLSGVDLNTVTESGLYYVSSGTQALHYPAGSNGHMLVMSDGTRVRQVYFRVGTVDTNNFQWYSRHLGSDNTVGDNGWSQWWLMSASERIFSGTAKLNAEINLGSRYGCQAWVIAGNVTDTGTVSTVYVPRYFLTTNQTKYKLQITDETGYVSFYFYYKESDDNVYAKVVWVSDVNNSAIKYAYRVS